MQWQPLRQVERPVQVQETARVVQLALVLAQVREPARVVQLARVAQRVLAQQVRAQQPHSLHQQLQSLCQPELCHLH